MEKTSRDITGATCRRQLDRIIERFPKRTSAAARVFTGDRSSVVPQVNNPPAVLVMFSCLSPSRMQSVVAILHLQTARG